MQLSAVCYRLVISEIGHVCGKGDASIKIELMHNLYDKKLLKNRLAKFG
jgi:hypothetical protein